MLTLEFEPKRPDLRKPIVSASLREIFLDLLLYEFILLLGIASTFLKNFLLLFPSLKRNPI